MMWPGDLKPFVTLAGEILTPPFSREARREAGLLIGRLQQGETLGMPHCRPMPAVSAGVLELRVRDEGQNWRLMCYVDEIAVVLLDVFAKKTQKTPATVIRTSRKRLAQYLKARNA